MEFIGVGGAVVAVIAALVVAYVWGVDFTQTILGAVIGWGGVFLLMRGIALGSAAVIMFGVALGPISLLIFWAAFRERG
jgi:hypothetical protein